MKKLGIKGLHLTHNGYKVGHWWNPSTWSLVFAAERFWKEKGL